MSPAVESPRFVRGNPPERFLAHVRARRRHRQLRFACLFAAAAAAGLIFTIPESNTPPDGAGSIGEWLDEALPTEPPLNSAPPTLIRAGDRSLPTELL